MSGLRVGSLFSGAGGLDLAVEEVFGGRTVWHCENDAAAAKVLARRWLGVPNFGDIMRVDWSEVEPVDVLCAGWPCQPFSLAGRRKGADDKRALWPYVAGAVRVVRPRIVVLENVSAVLGPEFSRVADDLAALGYDLAWTCLRAADVGAPHRRERVFIIAYTEGDRRHEGWPESARLLGGPDAAVSGAGPVNLLPTPQSYDGVASGYRSRNFASKQDAKLLSGVVKELLPTPRSSDCFGPGVHGDGGMDLRTAMSELAKENADAASEDRPAEILRDLRSGVEAQEICEREVGGSELLSAAPQLLPIVRELSDDGATGFAPLAGAHAEGAQQVRGLRHDGEAACPSQGSQPGEQRAGEPGGALQQLPSQTALAGGSRVHGAEDSRIDWGKYGLAIARWEAVLGRPAPNPTEPNRNGNPRLSAKFSSWLMGWPEGWVTQVPGVNRNDALRIIGNGVVPAQAATALRWLLAVSEIAV